jgi:SOS-response transcriptional repressor LexA
MYRGIKGTFIYAYNKDLREYLQNHIETFKKELPFRILRFEEAKPYVNSIPLVDISAAAGNFSDLQQHSDLTWIEPPFNISVKKGYFICKVIGESMNKKIPNGSYCLFKQDEGGTRNGRIVLVESSNIKDRDATKIKYIISKMNNVRNYYSPLLDKNPKQKLETEKLFFKPLDPKMATLYNDDEEIKIIQKLQSSESASDYDLLVDLENIRKYSYVNFKNFSKDGIKIRPSKTIQGIRYTNLKYKGNDAKASVEVRIGHDNIDMNVIGIAWNPSRMPLDCFEARDLIDVRKKLEEENGYDAFVKIMGKTFEEPSKKLYYWLFDNSKDKPKLESYVNYNTDDSQRNIKIMIEEIYKNYIRMVQHKLNTYIQKVEEFSIWSFDNILKGYAKKYFDFKLYPEMRNELIEKVILEKIQELPIEPDDVDSMIPGRREKLIELPVLELKKNLKNIIELGAEEIDVTLEMSKRNLPVCQHYVKWRNIMKISKKNMT